MSFRNCVANFKGATLFGHFSHFQGTYIYDYIYIYGKQHQSESLTKVCLFTHSLQFWQLLSSFCGHTRYKNRQNPPDLNHKWIHNNFTTTYISQQKHINPPENIPCFFWGGSTFNLTILSTKPLPPDFSPTTHEKRVDLGGWFDQTHAKTFDAFKFPF